MNTQLRQCFARAFRLKKARKKPNFSGFLFPKKAKVVSNSGLKKVKLAATLISDSASSFLLKHMQAFYIT